MDALPVTTMIYDGIEADDTMAYTATHLVKENEQAVIMSTDKDFLQLVNDTTIVWSPTKKKVYNTKTVKEEFGIESKNILLYRTLDGDNSDEIPGIKGCGIKTLLKRFPEFGEDDKLSMDDLLRLCEDKQSEKKSKKIKLYDDIIKAQSQLEMNDRLMQLHDPEISGNLKMNILSKYDEQTKPLNKMEFMKVCLKYKTINSFGNMSNWLNQTFGTLIPDKA